MKLIIAGTRTFDDYNLLKTKLNILLKNVDEEIVIVSGKASGADTLGEDYAKEKGYEILPFPAKWLDLSVTPCKIKYNKKGEPYNALAGFNRNEEMAKIADACVCFYDGKSRGTADMIELAKKYKLKLRIIYYDRD